MSKVAAQKNEASPETGDEIVHRFISNRIYKDLSKRMNEMSVTNFIKKNNEELARNSKE